MELSKNGSLIPKKRGPSTKNGEYDNFWTSSLFKSEDSTSNTTRPPFSTTVLAADMPWQGPNALNMVPQHRTTAAPGLRVRLPPQWPGSSESWPPWLKTSARWRSPKLVLSSLNHQINEDLKQIHGNSSFLMVFDGLSTKIGENKLGCLLISATKQCGSQCKSPAVQSWFSPQSYVF